MTTFLVVAVSVVGAAAVICFAVFLAIGRSKGWRHALARRMLQVAGALGIVCAVLGAFFAFTDT